MAPVTPSEKRLSRLAPIGHAMTIPAKANWSTSPHTTVNQRMRARFLDSSVASPMITARPMRPVKRSTGSSSHGADAAARSVTDLVLLASPLLERHQRFRPQQLRHLELPSRQRPRDLAVDPLVVEVDARRVLARGAVI